MQGTLIESNGKERIAYESLILSDLKPLSIFNSKLPLKIVKALAESPAPAIDIARKLKVHEQKIYYHIRKLEKAGIIYPISNERRHGMIAKIYSVVSPVISAKLYDSGVQIKENTSIGVSNEIVNFFEPFIQDGLLNAKIIIPSPFPHGPYGATARHDTALFDFGVFLGKMIESNGINYVLDTQITESDLKKSNLILIGNSKTNSVTHKINNNLPINFDDQKDFQIVSKLTGKTYTYDFDAMITKIDNPFNHDKKILLLAGKRSQGLVSAVLAIKTHISEIMRGNDKNRNVIAMVITGSDKNSDGIIDSIKILE